MWKRIKRGITLLLSVAMIASTAQVPVITVRAEESPVEVSTSGNTLMGEDAGEEEEEILEGYTEEYFDLGEVETSAISRDFLGLSDGKVTLVNGTEVKWIDRLDLSGDAQVIKNLYNTLAEASDNDGVDDYLIGDTYFDGDNAIVVATITGALDGTYSEEDAGNEVSAVASEIFANYSKYMRAAYDAFDRDHPEVFWLDGLTQGSAGTSYWMTGQENAYAVNYEININFVLENKSGDFDIRADGYRSENAIKEGIKTVDAKVSELVAIVSDKTTVEKITYFNEQLTKINEYNTSEDLNTIGHDCRECTSALVGKTGNEGPVCEAYARAFKVLCDQVEIPCVLVDGQAKNSADSNGEAHMWNYVQVDDEWLAVDVTWNDPVGGNTGAVSGVENEKWLLVYGDSEISDGMTFLESHPVANQVSVGGVSFINGPELAVTANEGNVKKVETEAEFNSALLDSSVGIIELTKEITLSRSADSKDNVFVIDRPVTITGGSEGLGSLRLERSGIILGGDVTFENMKFNFVSPVRNAIIANGYSLTINNVSSTGTYAVDLFCGGITDYNGGNGSEIPNAGSEGRITMKGTNTIGTNIYAGSLSDVGDGVDDTPNTYDGDVVIVLEKDAAGFSNIYAHGAREDRSGGNYDSWLPSSELYKVEGNVSICLNEGKNVTVNGGTGGTKNAAFIYKDEGNGYLCNPILNNVDSIELLPSDSGTMAYLEPYTNQTDFNALSIPEKTRLSFGNMGQEISVTSFAGGGEIVFTGTSQKMIVGTAAGTTRVAVGGVDADGTGSTGTIDADWTCITVTDSSSEHGFVLMPNSNNSNMFLEEDGNGNWITTLAATSARVKEITVESSFKVDSAQGYAKIPITVLYATENETDFLGDIPMTVTVNGEQISRSIGNFGYEYFTGESETDLVMWFEYSDNENEEYLYITTDGADCIPGGRYSITLTIPANCMEAGQSKTIEFNLVITVDGMAEQEPLKIEGLPGRITYGETVDFSITGGSGEGDIVYDIQGDGAATIDENETSLTATKPGTITIVAHKAGDEEYNEAASEEITIEILPAELKLKEVTYVDITEAGKTLKDTGLEVKATSLDGEAAEGTIFWGSAENPVPETTLVEANTRYTWNFESSDENYAVLSGTVMPYCVHQWEQNITEEDTGITVTISCTEEKHIGDLAVQTRHNCTEGKTYRLSYPNSAKKLYYTGEKQEASVFSEDFTEKNSIVYEIWNGNGWNVLEENEVPNKAGKYRTSVMQLGKTASIEYEIIYLETEAAASAPTEWVTEAVITAPEGFTISRTIDGEYASSILIAEESESETGTIVTYYLKETKTGYMTNAKTLIVKVSATGENPDEPGENKEIYTVSFNDIDGSALYEVRTINKGETIEKPEDPMKEGYKFLGWFVEGSETSYQFDNPVTSNLVLIAKWLDIGEIKEEDLENLTDIQDKIWVAGIEDVWFKGSKHTFNLRVYDGNKLLTSGKDYTVSYKNNQDAYEYSEEDLKKFEEDFAKDPKTKEAGEFQAAKAPQVILKMKGDYSGTRYIYFRIHPLSVAEDCFAQDLSAVYDAKKVQEPKPVVTWNGKTLKNGKDYTFEVTGYPQKQEECKEPGTYTVTITGKGNFEGTDIVNYIIADPENQVAMSKVKVDSIKAVKYSEMSSQGAKPAVTVRDGKTILKLGEDYTVDYKNNQKAGTAYAVITGKGTKYVGCKTVSFKITGTSISKITYDKKISYEYTGKEIKPFEMGFEIKDKETGQTLTAGTHFFVTYSKNVNRGTATMSLKGNEDMGYTGTTKINFAITAKSVKNLSITFAGGAEGGTFKALYMKGGSKPVMLVKDGRILLKEGTDYTVSYKNNRKAAKAEDGKNAPMVIIQGKGNYKDKSEQLKFTIENKALTAENGIRVVAKDKIFKDKAKAYHQSFKVYDADGTALSKSDYDVKNAIYEEVTIAEDGSVEVIKQLDDKSKVDADSVIRITVKGKGVYDGGSVSGMYRILKAGYDISKATIQIQNQPYTGKEIEIISQEQFVEGKVFLKIDEKTRRDLELDRDFEVVSYQKNTKKGTAKVTFRGKGDFGGEKTVTFKIVQRNVNTNW